jgi:tetratricopeptide (TPR) repeat protein
MSNHWIALLLPVGLSIMLVGQQPATPPNSGISRPDFSKEAFVIEQFTRKVKFENDGTSSQEDTARIRIQSDAGLQRYGLLTFDYASSTSSFEIEYVRVRKTDGTVVDTPPDSAQDMAAQITREAPLYSDLREKHVAVRGLSVGDVLEYQARTVVNKSLAPGQFWTDYNFTRDAIVISEQLEVRLPRERAVKIASKELKPVISDSGTFRVYVWTNSNLQPKEKDEKQEQIKTTWQTGYGRFPRPDVMLSSFQSWDQIGAWYSDLQKDRVTPNTEIQEKAAELTKGAADDDARLHAIYNYVSTQFRYIGVDFGIGRYQPHSASSVLENQFGDCKDKHTLLASLLTAAGIKAYPVLISSAREIDTDLPSPSQFNHVITVVPRANGLVWLDTTTEVAPFEYLIPALRNKHALIIWNDKPASIGSTPQDLPFAGNEVFHMDATLSDDGTLTGNADFTARGDLEYILRVAFRSVSISQWKELVHRISLSLGFGGDVSDVTASTPEKTDEPFHFAYKYMRKNYGDWTNRQILAPAPVLALPSPDLEDDNEFIPLPLGAPREIALYGRIQIPKSYSLEPPSEIHLKKNFAQYDATYSFKEGALISERHLKIVSYEVPKSSFEEYKNFYKTVFDDYGSFIPLTSATVSPQSEAFAAVNKFRQAVQNLPDSANPEALRLEQEARDDISRNDKQSATSALYRAVAADPKFVRAWIFLGEILMASQQNDAANEAFRKAVEVDSKQPLTYKVYAYSLMSGAKLEEAVDVWREFVKLAPEDIDGPYNLGVVLARLKRYDEAANAFQLASNLKPDSTSLQRQLASAYLNSNRDDAAQAIYQKLAESDPTPEMLNDAAFTMAEADKLPTLAQEFAEKAIRVKEDASTRIALSTLTLDDLHTALALSAYWDTLGWAQNRVSKLDQSQKYLEAAWRVSQDGEVASHLCHVYERVHKTDAAIQMCRLALHRLPLSVGHDPAQIAAIMKRTQSALDHLSPGPQKPSTINATLDEIARLRTFKLPHLLQGTATAEFFVVLAVDPETLTFKTQDFKYIKGSEKLESLGKALKSVDFKLPSPDGRNSRIVLRGTLGCYQYSGCEFVLFDPSIAPSLN